MRGWGESGLMQGAAPIWRWGLPGAEPTAAYARAGNICDSLPTPICRSNQILRFLVSAAIRMPKLAGAVAFLVLAVLASTLSYAGFLVVGVLAEQLGTSRVVAGLLLGGLFARFPWVVAGKLRIVGLLPQAIRRPLIVGLPALCLVYFLARGDYLPALVTGFATGFLLTYPWLRRAIFDRILSFVFKSPGQHPFKRTDHNVIDGEFREKKD